MEKDKRDFNLAWWLIFAMLVSSMILPILWTPVYSAENQYKFSLVGEFLVVIAPIFVGVSILAKRGAMGGLGFNRFSLKVLPFVIFLALFAQPFINIVTWPLTIETRLLFDVETVVDATPMGISEWICGFFAISILAPFVEELVFRGILMEFFKKYGALSSLLMTSLAFSMMHFSPESAILMFFVGFLLGVIRLATDSIWPAIIAHAANNTIAFLLSVVPGFYDKITTPILIVEIILFPIMLCFLLKISKNVIREKVQLEPVKKAGFSLGKLLSIIVYSGYAGIILIIKMIKSMTYYM